MKRWIDDIEEATKENFNFRKVLFTAPHSQLVVMSIEPGEEIGLEVHKENDQFIRIEEGEGVATINGEEIAITEDWAMVIPAGTEHNVINTSPDDDMKLYTIYSPPHHPDGTIHATKQDADKAETEETEI